MATSLAEPAGREPTRHLAWSEVEDLAHEAEEEKEPVAFPEEASAISAADIKRIQKKAKRKQDQTVPADKSTAAALTAALTVARDAARP